MSVTRAIIWIAAVFAAVLGTTAVRADRAGEIAAIHVAAIGGRAEIDALRAYRATGHIVVDGRRIALTVVAARPARLRVEMRDAGRTIIQATDGVHPPWQFEPGKSPALPVPMKGIDAEDFIASAEFDDPLVGAEHYGCSIDYAGEMNVDGRPMYRLLVAERFTKLYALIVDPQTYFIVARVDEGATQQGAKVRMITRYGNYRPVAGVLSPYSISVYVDGKPTREAVFDEIEPNPPVASELFTRP